MSVTNDPNVEVEQVDGLQIDELQNLDEDLQDFVICTDLSSGNGD